MSQRETEAERAMYRGTELGASEAHLALLRLLAFAVLIGLATTAVGVDSVAGPPDLMHQLMHGLLDVLTKAGLSLLTLITVATGFRLVCAQTCGLRSHSTEVSTKQHSRQGWLS